MEPDSKFSGREILRTLKIIHLAIVFSSTSLLVVSFVIISEYGALAMIERANSQILLTAGLLGGAILAALAYYVHSSRIKKDNGLPFISRLIRYKSSMIVKIALLEAAIIFLLVVYLITSIWSLLAGSAILIILLMLNRPGKNMVANELNLNDNEIAQLQNTN
jgi:hypothetical protein